MELFPALERPGTNSSKDTGSPCEVSKDGKPGSANKNGERGIKVAPPGPGLTQGREGGIGGPFKTALLGCRPSLFTILTFIIKTITFKHKIIQNLRLIVPHLSAITIVTVQGYLSIE